MLKKLLIGTAALATVASPIAASARPYDGGHRDHDNTGAAVAAGLFGLVLGAAIASSNHHGDYNYDRDYGYRDYGYGGYRGYSDYAPYPVRCHWETRAYPGPWGSVSYQQVQVCR